LARSVLVVDDSPTIRGFAKLLLRALKFDVLEAADGVQALVVARAAAVAPVLVLSDIQMPGMDGFALARELRTDEKLRAIPIVFLSGDVSEEMQQKGREAGACGILGKPLKAPELKGTLERYLGEIAA
jgi:CheY-like chemotaxis protein